MLRPTLRHHGGPEVKTLGGGFLAEFPNAPMLLAARPAPVTGSARAAVAGSRQPARGPCPVPHQIAVQARGDPQELQNRPGA